MDILGDVEEDVDLSFEMSNDGFHPNTSRNSDEDQDSFNDESKKNSSEKNSNEFGNDNNRKLGMKNLYQIPYIFSKSISRNFGLMNFFRRSN